MSQMEFLFPSQEERNDAEDDWKVPSRRPSWSAEAHRITYSSRHCRSTVWPIHDLIYNDILIWLLPTHYFTHCLKNALLFVIYILGIIAVHTQTKCIMFRNFQVTPQVLYLFWSLLFFLWLFYNRRILYYILWKGAFPAYMNPYLPAHRRRRMPSHAGQYFTNESTARRGAMQFSLQNKEATNVVCLDSVALNEDWKFRLFATPQEALRAVHSCHSNTDANTMAVTAVPSHWTLRGQTAASSQNEAEADTPIYTNIQYPFRPCAPPMVPAARNPTGLYQITLPTWPWAKDDINDDDEYTVRLHGIESAAYVFWNGTYIGFTKDSRLPAEFLIPPHLLFAEPRQTHTLQLVVIKWCDGIYVEDQDHWYLSGIHRSVELVRRPAAADLVDFQIQADANGHFECAVGYLRRDSVSRVMVARLYNDRQRSVVPGDPSSWQPGECMWEMRHLIAEQNKPSPSSGNQVHFVDTLSDIQPWSAEVPNLYTFTITLYDVTDVEKEDTWVCRQSESCRVGFRTIDIVAPGVVTINGRRVTAFAGINRHEHDPDYGKVISFERMQQDLCLLKQNNFNLVRTSHYPNHPSFYKLTDFYGLYVWDEANIEVHGMKPMGRLAHDFGWRATFLSRITRMVHRDRNHASVIFWSLGNEAGRGRNLSEARRIVKILDPSRPVVYESGGALAEGTGRTELTDIICTMYPVLPRVKRLATRRDEDRPIILCEYSHSMGNSNGNLHYYWNAFWDDNLPRLQGGCIWDMIDEGIRVPGDPSKANASSYFAYGGDFNEPIHDAQFCINGMFSPDREPHPALSEIRFLQQPVHITPATIHESARERNLVVVTIGSNNADTSALFHVFNRYTFRDLSHLSWSWQLKSNRSSDAIRSGHFTVPSVGGPITISLSDVLTRVRLLERSKPLNVENTYWMNIRGCLKEKTTWADTGHIVVRQQFCVVFQFDDEVLSLVKPNMKASVLASLETRVNDSNGSVEIFRAVSGEEKLLARIDKSTGVLSVYAPHGKNLLMPGLHLEPNFVRAVTDNDRGGLELALNFLLIPSWAQRMWYNIYGFHNCSYASHWKFVGLHGTSPPRMVCSRMRVTDRSNADAVGIVALCTIVAPVKDVVLMKLKLHYKIYSDGRVKVSNHLNPLRPLRHTPSLPRVGMKVTLDPSLHHIQYYGRGPHENYPDRKSSAEMGVYQTAPSQMFYHQYIVPSENGSRSDCEYASFRSLNGDGVGIVTTKPDGSLGTFAFSALPFGIPELDDAMHTCDLPDRSEDGKHAIHVNIDHQLMGLGGDTSWFPGVYDEFLVKPNRDFHYRMWLLPLSKEDDIALRARVLPYFVDQLH